MPPEITAAEIMAAETMGSAMEPGPTTLRRDRKLLAAAPVPVVTITLSNPTDMRAIDRNRARRKAEPITAAKPVAKAEGMQGVAFLHRESRPNTRPNRTQRPR